MMDKEQKRNEYDQEIPQSDTADQPTAQKSHRTLTFLMKMITAKQPALSLPRQDDCKTGKDTKYYRTKQRPITEPTQTMGGSQV